MVAQFFVVVRTLPHWDAVRVISLLKCHVALVYVRVLILIIRSRYFCEGPSMHLVETDMFLYHLACKIQEIGRDRPNGAGITHSRQYQTFILHAQSSIRSMIGFTQQQPRVRDSPAALLT